MQGKVKHQSLTWRLTQPRKGPLYRAYMDQLPVESTLTWTNYR
jgi:hypothetical protein